MISGYPSFTSPGSSLPPPSLSPHPSAGRQPMQVTLTLLSISRQAPGSIHARYGSTARAGKAEAAPRARPPTILQYLLR